MNELLKFAKDRNADQVYAIIDERFKEDKVLTGIYLGYENGYLTDQDFCDWVVNIVELYTETDEVE